MPLLAKTPASIENAPRRVFLWLAAFCMALLGFGLYLQHGVGLVPCPMCIVQRYALFFVALVSGLTWAFGVSRTYFPVAVLLLVTAGFGAFVAARQSWLQWFPPAVASCGRDFYGMIEAFPIGKVIPMIFKGSGDCSAVEWTFLGGSLANWSFLVFCAVALLMARLAWGLRRR